MDLKKTFLLIASSLIALAWLLILILINLNVLINLRPYYDYGFSRYQVTASTGLSHEELNNIRDSLIDYFNQEKETPQIFFVRDNNKIALYSERELIHLDDVRKLIILGNSVQITCMVSLAVLVILMGLIRGVSKIGYLFKPVLNGCVFAVSTVLVVSLVSLIDFNRLFILFHIASFSNEYWILDPSQHYLIRLFPQGFFLDAFSLILLASLTEALLVGGGAFSIYKLNSR